jgi:mono/diheme cytochrome c family protein
MLPVPPNAFTKRSLCPPRSAEGAAAPPKIGYGLGNDEAGPPAISDLAVLDAKDASFFGSGLPPLAGPQCLLPRAAAAAGSDALVACLGSARVMRMRPSPQFDFAAGRGGAPGVRPDGMFANVGARPIPVPPGPSGIATARGGERAFVWSAFARTLTEIDPKEERVVSSVSVPRSVDRSETWLAGRELFFTNGDKRISGDGRACASCHVDGRDDGLTWKTPKGLRRTRILAGETSTAPFGWMGENPTLDAHVQLTIKNLAGIGLPIEERTQLIAFVGSLPRPPSSPSLDAETERGREIFATAECVSCHTSGASDRMVHDVGTGGSFLTPTLSGVATRTRLMHDGRHRSLDELLVASTAMGRAASLGAEDRRALVRYLGTL